MIHNSREQKSTLLDEENIDRVMDRDSSKRHLWEFHYSLNEIISSMHREPKFSMEHVLAPAYAIYTSYYARMTASTFLLTNKLESSAFTNILHTNKISTIQKQLISKYQVKKKNTNFLAALNLFWQVEVPHYHQKCQLQVYSYPILR